MVLEPARRPSHLSVPSSGRSSSSARHDHPGADRVWFGLRECSKGWRCPFSTYDAGLAFLGRLARLDRRYPRRFRPCPRLALLIAPVTATVADCSSTTSPKWWSAGLSPRSPGRALHSAAALFHSVKSSASSSSGTSSRCFIAHSRRQHRRLLRRQRLPARPRVLRICRDALRKEPQARALPSGMTGRYSLPAC